MSLLHRLRSLAASPLCAALAPLAVVAALAMAACDSEKTSDEGFLNSEKTSDESFLNLDCRQGQICLCTGEGDCTVRCEGAGCTPMCTASGKCTVQCPEGGCMVTSEAHGNTDVYCAGGGCTISCVGRGNCTMHECAANCNVLCYGSGACTNSCDEAASCTTAQPNAAAPANP